MLDVSRPVTVTASAAVAVAYTLAGGMRSVAYTDVLQLVFIFGGLWLAMPFVFVSGSDLSGLDVADWTGRVTADNWVTYVDTFLLIVCGGIPWQPYYQVSAYYVMNLSC